MKNQYLVLSELLNAPNDIERCSVRRTYSVEEFFRFLSKSIVIHRLYNTVALYQDRYVNHRVLGTIDWCTAIDSPRVYETTDSSPLICE
jgi:hypothetical protein